MVVENDLASREIKMKRDGDKSFERLFDLILFDRRHKQEHKTSAAGAEQLSPESAVRDCVRIKLIDVGNNMNVELLLDVDGEHLRARITRDALEELDLAVGRDVFALIKSVALESSLGP